MKINKEQYAALVAKLDAIQGIESKIGRLPLERIEHGQDVLCERLDALRVPNQPPSSSDPCGEGMPLGEAIAKLLRSHAALEKVVLDHDKWAKDYNVTVEARNAKALKQMTEWRAEQEKAVTGLCNLLERYLLDLHALVAAKKPASKRNNVPGSREA